MQSSNALQNEADFFSLTPSPYSYLKLRATQVQFLKDHHYASVINNCNITPATIHSNKRLQYSNKISYIQAQCTIQALLVEIDSDKVDCFAKFPAYIERYKAADPKNYAQLKLSERGNFEAVFFCLAGCVRATSQLRMFIAVDGTHTRSRY